MTEARETTVPTSATSTTSDFREELRRLNESFEDNKPEILSSERQKACEEAAADLLTGETARANFERIAAESARRKGSKGCCLRRWSMKDNLAYNDSHYLLDLLNKGSVLEEMQAWLDTTYGEGMFLVYYHKVRNSRHEFAVAISWEEEKFDTLRDIIKRSRDKHASRDRDDDREDDRRDNRYDDRRDDRRRYDGPPRRNTSGFRRNYDNRTGGGFRRDYRGPPRGRVFRDRRDDDRDTRDRREDDRSSNFRPRRPAIADTDE